MDEMMKAISKNANGTYLKIIWGNGKLELEGYIDTIYETDNGFDPDDYRYQELYACAFMIKNIIKNLTSMKYCIGQLIEISMNNKPSLISLKNGEVVWP